MSPNQMKVELCNFSGQKIYPSKGKIYVRGDSKVSWKKLGECGWESMGDIKRPAKREDDVGRTIAGRTGCMTGRDLTSPRFSRLAPPLLDRADDLPFIVI